MVRARVRGSTRTTVVPSLSATWSAPSGPKASPSGPRTRGWTVAVPRLERDLRDGDAVAVATGDGEDHRCAVAPGADLARAEAPRLRPGTDPEDPRCAGDRASAPAQGELGAPRESGLGRVGAGGEDGGGPGVGDRSG